MRKRRGVPHTELNDDWVVLASAENQADASTRSWRKLAELGVPLPERPTRRDVWAAGINDNDIRVDVLYLGTAQGRCVIQIGVRKTALDAAVADPTDPTG